MARFRRSAKGSGSFGISSICFALEKTLNGFFPLEAYRDLGFSRAQIGEVRRYRRETAAHHRPRPPSARGSSGRCTRP